MVTLFDVLSLIASVVGISIGIVVYSINRKALLNRLFLLTCFFGVFYAFAAVMMWQSSSLESAFLWSKLGSIWPFFAVAALHFSLVFTQSKWLKNKLTYIALYLPALSFWFIDLSTSWINSTPSLTYWGYDDASTGTLIYWISTVWVALLPLLAFVLCFRYYSAAKEEAQKKQRRAVAVGLGIPIGTFIVTNILLPSTGILIPNMGFVSFLFFGGFVGYAILKYELFTFDAAMAAENIISTIPDSLILADIKGKMMKVNRRMVDFSGYREDELVGSSILKLCDEQQDYLDIQHELSDKRVCGIMNLLSKQNPGRKKRCCSQVLLFKAKRGVT